EPRGVRGLRRAAAQRHVYAETLAGRRRSDVRPDAAGPPARAPVRRDAEPALRRLLEQGRGALSRLAAIRARGSARAPRADEVRALAHRAWHRDDRRVGGL